MRVSSVCVSWSDCPTPPDPLRIVRARAVLRLLMACGLSVLFCGSPAAQDASQSDDSGHAPAGAPDTGCSALAGLDIPDARILSATRETDPTDHCKVTGLVGGKIGFKVWLPVAWNGRLVMGGAGGFVNVDVNQALQFLGEQILAEGYATASTDTGHAVPNARDGAWALGDWEAIVNYAHLGMHRAVVHAKLVIERHYLRSIEKSFFFGCSNGGRQALMEAQRYPEDFDGIIAGAPWLNWTGQVAAFIAIAQQMFPDPENLSAALVTRDDRLLLRRAILARCDALDGLHDGILHDPTACDFDPGTLACSAERDPRRCRLPGAGEGGCYSRGVRRAGRRRRPALFRLPVRGRRPRLRGLGRLSGGRCAGGRLSEQLDAHRFRGHALLPPSRPRVGP